MIGTDTKTTPHQRCTLLIGPAGDPWQFAVDMLGFPVDVARIPEPEWTAAYGLSRSGALLIDPDGRVLWQRRALNVCLEPPEWALAAALAATSRPVAEAVRA